MWRSGREHRDRRGRLPQLRDRQQPHSSTRRTATRSSSAQSARNGYVVNNTIDNTTTPSQFCAIVLWGTGTWADSNILIANNLITNVAGSGSNAVCASLGKNLTGNVVRNNLAYGVNGTAYDPSYGSYTGFAAGTNLPSADPMYVDRAGTYGDLSTKNFHLQR